jgi:serine/threonine protein kinase
VYLFLHTLLNCSVQSLAVRVHVGIVRGLAFFHTYYFLHLDMTSPNILLNYAGAKIADIGLDKNVQEGDEGVQVN